MKKIQCTINLTSSQAEAFKIFCTDIKRNTVMEVMGDLVYNGESVLETLELIHNAIVKDSFRDYEIIE